MPNLHNRLRSMQLFLAKLSLQTRFLLIFGAASLFLALIIWFAFDSIAERMMERIGGRLAENQALYDKAHILQPLIRKLSIMHQMADNATIKRWAADRQNPQLRQQALAEMELFHRHFQDNSSFLILVHPEDYHPGKQPPNNLPWIKHLRYPMDGTEPANAWFHTAIKDAGIQQISVGSGASSGVNEILIRMPLHNGGKLLGIIGASLVMDGLPPEPASDIFHASVSNIFIDRDATIQIYRDIKHLGISGTAKPANQKLHIDYVLDNPEDAAWIRQSIEHIENSNQTEAGALHIKGKRYLSNSPVVTKFVHINGKSYLAGMTAVPEIGWYDITLVDTSALLSQHDFLEMWLAIGGGALCLMLILLFSLRRLVLQPIAVLTAASDRIRQGDYARASPRKGSGEIGRLTAQFQAMRRAVHKTHNWMDDEIRKRTQQIRDAKEMLEVSLQQERNRRENQANLLSLMAHEIRNPIAVIGNTAQMLNTLAYAQQPDWQPRIEKIMGAVLQLSVLMNKFLDEDCINMSGNELDLKMDDLNDFCGRLANALAANYRHPIHYSPCSENSMLLADWHLIGIAIGNLLDNAIKYSPPDGKIDMCIIQNKAGMLCVEVTDQGSGIAPELQQRIFNEKFIRGEHKSNIRGTGLGLYLINWIATSHGGYAEVSSMPDSGSTFRIYLPQRKPA